MPYRVTFVCTGNICRSPMAEHVFRRHADEAGLDVQVDSSGTGPWHVGAPADPRTVRTLQRHGYTYEHRGQQFQSDWFDRYDLIIALDRGHVHALQRLAPSVAAYDKIRLLREFDPAARGADVPDPYSGGQRDFENVMTMVEASMPGLVDYVRTEIKSR